MRYAIRTSYRIINAAINEHFILQHSRLHIHGSNRPPLQPHRRCHLEVEYALGIPNCRNIPKCGNPRNLAQVLKV